MDKQSTSMQEAANLLLEKSLQQPGVAEILEVSGAWNRIGKEVQTNFCDYYMPRVVCTSSSTAVTELD